jgi:two-component sensor histidine kinase
VSILEKALVAVITIGAAWVGPHIEALRLAGARVRLCAPDGTLWSILTALDYDAIMVADVEAGVRGLGRALGEDARLRSVPTIVLLGPGASRERDIDLVAIDSDDPEKTVAAVEALVDGHASRRWEAGQAARPGSLRPGSLRPGSLPPPDSPARRELELGFHDLRVLLGIIVGYGANLRDGADGALSETQRDHVLKMIEAATDATVLLQQTMSASRTAALSVPAMQPLGTQRLHVDITALAQSVVRMFARAASQRDIDLACTGTQPIQLWGNGVHLKQVVANLVVNALKFAGPGGRVRVATRVGVGSQAEIVVSDTGPGVPVEERDRIFDHGVRLERDVGIGGTGIGLAVVRELVVVHHGGTVRVGDAEGGGAEFVVSLPLDRRSRVREGGAASRELPSSGRIRAGDAR